MGCSWASGGPSSASGGRGCPTWHVTSLVKQDVGEPDNFPREPQHSTRSTKGNLMSGAVSPWAPIQRAVRTLAGVCDGARTADGQGFDGGDVFFGHRAAALPLDRWTPWLAAACRDLLAGKYHRQLVAHGIDVQALARTSVALPGKPATSQVQAEGRAHARTQCPKPPSLAPGGAPTDDPFAMPTRTALLEHPAAPHLGAIGPAALAPNVALRFAYDIDLNSEVKALTGATWDDTTRTWRVRVTPRNAAALAALLDTHYFDVPLAVQVHLQDEAKREPDPHIYLHPEDASRVVIHLDGYSEPVVRDVKKVLGSKWDASSRTWTLPVVEGRAIHALAETHGLDIAKATVAVLDEARDRVEKAIAASQATSADLHVPGLLPGRSLRPFQLAGVAYATSKRRTWISDEVGLGKTLSAFSTVAVTGSWPVVVVVKSSLKKNAANDFVKFFGAGRKVVIVDGMAPTPIDAQADVIIINYDLLGKAKPQPKAPAGSKAKVRKLRGIDRIDRTKCRLDDVLALKPRALVVDESQMCKESDALRTICLKEIGKDVQSRDGIILLLSGTPQKNRPRELWPQLEIIGRADEFGGYMEFTKRYCGGFFEMKGGRRIWNADGISNPLELHERLRATCYVRRLKRDVLPELPELDRQQVLLPMSPNERRVYDKAKADIVTHLAERAKAEALAAGVDLTEANKAAFLARVRAKAAEQLVAVNELRRLAGLAKLTAVFEWIDQFMDAGTPLIVYAFHQDVQQAIIDRYGCPSIQSQTVTNQSVIEQNKRTFLSGQHDLLLASVSAAAEGHSLGGRLDAANSYAEVAGDPDAPWGVGCTNIAEVQLPWTPGDEIQISGRVHGRLNAIQGATLWRLLADDSIDIGIGKLLERKAADADAVQDGIALPAGYGDSLLGELVASMTEEALGYSTDLFDATDL